MKHILAITTIFLINFTSPQKQYQASDCKNGALIDIGLNPAEHRRKAKMIFKQGEELLTKW